MRTRPCRGLRDRGDSSGAAYGIVCGQQPDPLGRYRSGQGRGPGNDISDLPAAGSAPEWMSEKAISIGHYFVTAGVYTVFGVTPARRRSTRI